MRGEGGGEGGCTYVCGGGEEKSAGCGAAMCAGGGCVQHDWLVQAGWPTTCRYEARR